MSETTTFTGYLNGHNGLDTGEATNLILVGGPTHREIAYVNMKNPVPIVSVSETYPIALILGMTLTAKGIKLESPEGMSWATYLTEAEIVQ